MQGKERGLFLSREGCEGKARWLSRLFGQRKKLCLVLLCVLMNHALREGPTRDLGVSRAGRSLPGLRGSRRSAGMLRGDAETPAVRGHRAGRTRFCSRPSGTQVIVPSGLPRSCSFSRAGSSGARPLCRLHPRLSGPRSAPGGGARRRLPLPGVSQPRLWPDS